MAYLTLNSTGFIVTLGGGHTTSYTNPAIPGLNTSPLGQVFFSLLLSDLNLLLFTTTTKLVRPELVPGLELGATMLGDVAFGHGCLGHKRGENKAHQRKWGANLR